MNQRAAADHNHEFLAVLGLAQPVTLEDVKQAYLDKAKTAHPDRGGDKQQFIKLQTAYEQATEYVQFKAGRMQWLSRWVEQYAEQQQAIDEIHALGGTVDVKPCDWLTQSIGPDFATVLDRLSAVRLTGPKIENHALQVLTSKRRILSGLQKLELINTSISPRGLQDVQVFEALKHLDLTGTRVGALAVRLLVDKLPVLETLNLRGAGVSWWARMKIRYAHRDLTIGS